MTRKIALLFFLLTLIVRIIIIYVTPSQNEFIDLNIYRDAGELVSNGINPYDFDDNVQLRQRLRTDSVNYNSFVSETQSRWDYYSSSNLPLANTLFGFIEKQFNSAVAYRISFAFGDSLVAVLILLILLNVFKVDDWRLSVKLNLKSILVIGFTLLLCTFSPYMLLWGVLLPGPKGIGLLFVLSSIYFSLSKSRFLWLILSPILLAISVNFIGLGLFIAPLVFAQVLVKLKSKVDIVVFVLLGAIVTLFSLLPFIPEIFEMMLNRSAPKAVPQHASMWVLLYKIWPNYWIQVKYFFIVVFVMINIIGILKKRIDISIVSASSILLFTVVYLDAGSMDRINIAIVSSLILILISGHINFFVINTISYFIFGLIALIFSVIIGVTEIIDAFFCIIFILQYFFLIVYKTFGFNFINEPKLFARRHANYLD